ncbi:GNAT family acetyltransferase [Erwinia sp. CPCC 100877]|nr:GNAT family acetyltransferase [Erwinia sp. CPCC 100877]
MALDVISLSTLLKSDSTKEEIENLLFSFEKLNGTTGCVDIEYFLHKKAIEFEKMDLARTYLVLSKYKDKVYLAGYFAIAPKPLVIKKKVFKKISNTQQKKLMGFGHKTDQNNYECKGYLIGQLGKNYSKEAIMANQLSGSELLQLAYRKIKEAHEIVGGRVVHLECQNIPKLKEFYKEEGFREIENRESEDDLCIFVKTIDKI